MPYAEKWKGLQQLLADRGFLLRQHIQDVATDKDINKELIAAIKAALQTTGSGLQFSDRIKISDIDRLGDVSSVLKDRFCSLPDRGTGKLDLQTFGSPGGRWTRGVLRVSINTAGCNYTVGSGPVGVPDNPLSVIVNAFNQWQTVSNFFAFQIVPPNTREDIRAVFGGPSLDSRFGSPGGVSGSAGYPEKGNLQFDSSESWNGSFLLSVSLHEIGHLLGLSHSNLPGGTMNPYVNGLTSIDAESITAIRMLYGWQPQRRIGDRGTSHRAMLGITSGSDFTSSWQVPQMVWKGLGDDNGIFYSDFQGDWSPQQKIEGVGCSYSPVLTEIPIPGSQIPQSGLFMAWKGVEDDQGIYWTRNLGWGWEGQRNVAGVGTSAAPSLANLNGQIVMAWKGVNGDSGIYWSTYDGNEGWAPQQNVRGIGTTDSPALVVFNSQLFIFWKGIEGDSNAYYSSFDPVNDRIWKPQRRIEYFDYKTEGGIPVAIGTTGALSACVRGNGIFLAWKGVEGDSQIWFSLFANGEFSGQATVPNVGTSVGPSVVQVGRQTFMAWKGVEGDNAIYWATL